MTPELYYPVLDCFLRGLPHAYRDFGAPAGTTIGIDISGECGGTWLLSSQPSFWQFTCAPVPSIACQVTIPQEIAWRVFTKGIDRNAARAQSTIEGDARLAEPLFGLTAIVG